MQRAKRACIVVLYNPDAEAVRKRVDIILAEFPLIVLVDNSENTLFRQSQTLRDLEQEGVLYYGENKNKGIAWAFNKGIELACQKGEMFSWVMTMDQDSLWSNMELKKHCSSLDDIAGDVAMVAPVHQLTGVSQKYAKKRNNSFEITNGVMSSGSFLRLSAYEQVGAFAEELFIDYVDYEYC
jgi:rhamnosyltransferase